MIHDNILSLVGSTPMVRINRLNPHSGVTIAVKYERNNPGGSIKDRVALAMIEAAERSGELTPDKTIIEATSGNTGIGLAMVCAVKGYKIMLLMPDSASEERRRIMRAYGADIYLTPGHLSTDGSIEEAYRLAREEPDKYVLMDQFNNPASIEAHYRGTAQEIFDQTDGKVTHVVATLGTTGTAMGLTKRLKELNPAIQVMAVEPYAGHKIQGLKNMHESYPPGIYDKKVLDRVLHVEDDQAFSLVRQLAREEGMFVGMSSGAALAGALQVAAEIDQGMVVAIFPDGGGRYLSTTLFVPPAKQGLKLYNIQSQHKDLLDTDTTPVHLFTPGPSPDMVGNLESWRRILLLDVLTRHLERKGVPAAGIAGLADQEDQAVERAHELDMTPEAFSSHFQEEVRQLAKRLGVGPTVHFPTAGRDGEAMLKLCRKLLAKGRAYEKLRSVYYDVHRDPNYGTLGRVDLEKLSLGKTVDLEDYVKENPRDFTLLKRSSLKDLKAGDFVKTEWGNVRPSWYLQMAAAAMQDSMRPTVVLAGQTHQFPHLENLRSLWEQGAGINPKLWLISQPVNLPDGMDQSRGVQDILAMTSSPHVLRLWLLSTAYRKTLTVSEKNLKMWEKNWRRIQELAVSLSLSARDDGTVSEGVRQSNFDLKSGFTAALEDDLSLHQFWPVLFDYCRTINRLQRQGNLSGAEAAECLDQLRSIDEVLGIVDWALLPVAEDKWPGNVRDLVQEREQARKVRDFDRADTLREAILTLGFEVEDTPEGPRVYRK